MRQASTHTNTAHHNPRTPKTHTYAQTPTNQPTNQTRTTHRMEPRKAASSRKRFSRSFPARPATCLFDLGWFCGGAHTPQTLACSPPSSHTQHHTTPQLTYIPIGRRVHHHRRGRRGGGRSLPLLLHCCCEGGGGRRKEGAGRGEQGEGQGRRDREEQEGEAEGGGEWPPHCGLVVVVPVRVGGGRGMCSEATMWGRDASKRGTV